MPDQEIMIDSIQQLAELLPLENYFDWDIPENVPIEIPDDIEGSFARNIYLKEHLYEVLRDDPTLNSHYWTIREWGGIRSFPICDRNNDRIAEFIQQLPGGRLGRDLFARISSLSKLAAFLHPEQYSIYDARAIYALNWLLFRHSDDRQLFPQPTGRNAAINNLNTDTLYRLSGLEFGLRDWRTSYHEYCALIQQLSVAALGQENPYYLEMLLFVAAGEWVPNDVMEHTQVIIEIDFDE